MIGVNLWGLMPTAREDLPGLLQQLKTIGFDSVESMLIPKKRDSQITGAVSTQENFKTIYNEAKKCGLTVPGVHVFYKVGNRLLPKSSVIRTIRTLSREYGVETFAFSGAFTDAKGARKWAAYLNEITDALAEEPCKILYHNHDQELNLVTVRGKTMTALEYFFDLVDQRVLLELDIGWAGNGGDEMALAKQYADRIYILHLKDFVHGSLGKHHNPDVPKELFAPIGEGAIRTKEILDMRHDFPNFCGHIIIDQDFSATDLLEDLKVGYENVRNMLKEGA